MSLRTQIVATCTAMADNNIIIDQGPRHGGNIYPYGSARDDYLTACRDIFESDVLPYQRKAIGIEPSIWTPWHINTAVAYARKYNLTVKMLGPNYPDSGGTSDIFLEGTTIVLGIMIPPPGDSDAFLYRLDHETGHVYDRMNILAEVAPHLRPVLLGLQLTLEQRREFVKAHFAAIRVYIPDGKKGWFDGMIYEIFGDVDSMDIGQVDKVIIAVAEFLRLGEEIYDPREKDVVMDRDYPHFTDGGPDDELYRRQRGIEKGDGRWIDLHRLLLRAFMEAANIWDRFTGRDDFDASTTSHLKREHIDFFMACIYAASAYFYLVDECEYDLFCDYE